MDLAKFKAEVEKPGVDPMLNLVLDQSFHFLKQVETIPEIPETERNEIIADNMRESLMEIDSASRPHEPHLT